MNPPLSPPFANWQTFYEIIGSAAGALTGLQFLVITLIAQTRSPGSMREISAFGTPTVAHFCTALLISALMVAPWTAPAELGICLYIFGAIGVAYCIRVIWHAHQTAYRPDLEDWVWYTVFPICAHAALLVLASFLLLGKPWAPFGVAAEALLFLVIGIHNSWDTVTYIAVQSQSSRKDEDAKPTHLSGSGAAGK